MNENVAYDRLEEALQRCGSDWDAAQAHGLLTGSLAAAGVAAGPDWMLQVLADVDERSALRNECAKLLDSLYQATYLQLSERLSEFAPLLPDDKDDVAIRTEAIAHWSEGFLHGLVAANKAPALKERLAQEPLADIIKDVLQITRAGVDGDSDQEDNEAAYVELVEYLRVVAQLSFEELADIRNAAASDEA